METIYIKCTEILSDTGEIIEIPEAAAETIDLPAIPAIE